MIDSHCHLQLILGSQHDEIRNQESIFQIIHKANDIGLKKLLNVIEISSNENELQIIDLLYNQRYKDTQVYLCGGVHPCAIDSIDKESAIKLIESHIKKFIAIGETGLDLFKAINKHKQLEYLELHAELCKKYKLPIIIHARGCDIDDMLNILRPYHIKTMFHCWTFGPKELDKALSDNCMISFSGIVTFDKTNLIVDSAIICPINSMLIETDSPFLAPIPHRGRENSPALIVETYKFIAKLRNLGLHELSKEITTNFNSFFCIK
jgi:TatD DNase family protein